MKQLEQTIARTINALKSMPTTEIRSLPLINRALMLDALSYIDTSAPLNTALVEWAQQQLCVDWIKKGDLFEVFSVFTALMKHDSSYITGDHLTAAVQRLVECEVKVGGPYCSGATVEVAANLQISSFVRRAVKPLPNVEAFLNDAITSGRFTQALKKQPHILYLLYSSPHCASALQSCADAYGETPLYRAVKLTETHSPHEVSHILESISREQQKSGLWQEGNVTTSVLVCSILTRHAQRLIAASPSQLSLQHQRVVGVAKRLLRMHAEPLRTLTSTAIDKVCMVDKGYEITLLPYFFARSLKGDFHFSDAQCNLLGAANLYGWLAYTIYDDFLDNEGQPLRLPVANCAMRYALDCFQAAMPTHASYQRYVSRIFTEMDTANAWEVANCRFEVHNRIINIERLPQYRHCSSLASRSFAHVLGPMAVLAWQSKSGGKSISSIESAFRHYLIARQLADDLYDWTDDVQAGRISYVVTAILRDMRLSPGKYSLETLLPDMQKTYRRTTMTRACSLALHHTQEARRRFLQNGLVQTSDDIFTLLDTLERTLKHSADEYTKTITFTRVTP